MAAVDEPERRTCARALVFPGVVSTFALGGYLGLAPRAIPDSYAALPDLALAYRFARHCIWENDCALALGFTTGGVPPFGIEHGAMAHHLLAAVLAAGGEVFTLGAIQVAASALALVLFVFVVGRYAGAAWTPAAAFAYLAVSHPADYPYFIVWNGGFLSLPAVAALAGALAYQETGRRAFGLGAALSLGMGLQFHQSAILAAPMLLWAAWSAPHPARRRWLDLFLGLGVCAGTVAFGSYGMFRTVRYVELDLGSTGEIRLGAWPIGAALLAAVALVVWGYPAARRRTALALTATCVPFFALVLLTEPANRYLRPVYPGTMVFGAVAAATLVEWIGRQVPPERRAQARGIGVAAVSVAVVAALWDPMLVTYHSPPAKDVSDRECRDLSRFLGERLGWGYDEMFRHLRGARSLPTLLGCLSGHAPSYDEALAGQPDAVALHRPGPGAAGPGWHRVGDPPAWALRLYAPALDWDRMEVCVDLPLERCRWAPAAFERGGRGAGGMREPTGSPALGFAGPAPEQVRYRIPLRSGEGARWLVVPAAGIRNEGCGVVIESVAGRATQGEIPGPVVRVDGGGPSEVVLRGSFDGECLYFPLAPSVAEADDEQAEVVAAGLGRALPFDPPAAGIATAAGPPEPAPPATRGRPRGVLDLSSEPTASLPFVIASVLVLGTVLVAFAVWWPFAFLDRR